ncbi:MAG: endolytic transglycosylase MltG [Patescibacteria group bacterium]
MKKVKANFSLLTIVISIFVILFISSAVVIRQVYQSNLQAVSTEKKAVSVTVTPGSTVAEIGQNLHDKGAIKSDWAFEWYVRNNNLIDELKAGTYIVYTNQDVPTIARAIAEGKVATDLFTILPGKRIDEIRSAMIKAGFAESEVDEALKPANYKGHEALADLPEGSNLEGYLYPESYQKTAETKPKTIVKSALDELARQLTKERRQEFAKRGLTTHQAIIVASMVEREVSNKNDKPQVAQVFLKRLKDGMNLGSDVTAFYGAVVAGQTPTVVYDSPYNTRIHGGLPVGPISNVGESSLEAVAYPASTDWVYFVAGDDGKTYFSKTNEEHEALTEQHCKQLCQ